MDEVEVVDGVEGVGLCARAMCGRDGATRTTDETRRRRPVAFLRRRETYAR